MSSSPDKIRVAVLYGGRSAEHEVSLRSATNVMQFLDTSRFEIIPIGIDKEGNWFLGQETFAKSLEYKQIPQLLHKENQTWFTPEWVGKPITAQQQLDVRKTNDAIFDVVFPVVHGTLCEDGTLQGLLELTNIPYVGCGVLSSAIGMDKDISKRLAKSAGILVPPYIVLKQEQWHTQAKNIDAQVEQLGYPVFVKPANTGSSVGINKVKTAEQLQAAVNEAFQFDTKVVIEKGLNIIELEVAVLESLQPGAEPIASVVGEIRPKNHEFYSYDAKYVDEHGADLLIPAPISEQQTRDAQQIAKQLFQVLECEGMARVDLFLDKDSQQIYFNEINTLPGFTQISMYPKLMSASGMTYSDLLTHLIQLAIKRHKNKSQLLRNYAG